VQTPVPPKKKKKILNNHGKTNPFDLGYIPGSFTSFFFFFSFFGGAGTGD
jgi:hypothetical protein